MSELNLTAQKREITTKGAVNQLRRNGFVPGIFYSKNMEPISIAVSEIALKPLVFTAETHLVNLKVDNNEELKAILKGVQFDPVTDRVIHFDLHGITLGQALQLEVPVAFVGNAIGVKEGGVVQQHLHKLEIECLPGNIPAHLTVDLTNLHLGQSIHVSDLAFDNIKILNSENTMVVSVQVPKAAPATTETDAAGGEAKEPEVIGKGKADDKEEE